MLVFVGESSETRGFVKGGFGWFCFLLVFVGECSGSGFACFFFLIGIEKLGFLKGAKWISQASTVPFGCLFEGTLLLEAGGGPKKPKLKRGELGILQDSFQLLRRHPKASFIWIP